MLLKGLRRLAAVYKHSISPSVRLDESSEFFADVPGHFSSFGKEKYIIQEMNKAERK